MPPSTDRKAKRESARPGGAKPGHEPHNRRLAEDPEEVRDHKPDVCEECGGTFALDAAMELIGEYDEVPSRDSLRQCTRRLHILAHSMGN